MNEKWKRTPLGEMLTFQRGFDITKKEQTEGPYLVISSSGAKSTHKEYKVRGPGVIIGRKGTLGTVFYSEKDYWPHDTTLWIKDFHGNHPQFSYYFLLGLHLEQFDCGASNPTLNRNHIHLIDVSYPDVITQQKIATILSSYDDLIENNLQRIKILEEMAQRIFQEWFGHFHFPGHEKVKMVESELGLIPEEWTVKEIKQFGEVITGKTPSKSNPENFGTYMPFIKTPDMHQGVFCININEGLSEQGVQTQKNKTIPSNSLCVSCIGTVGIVSITVKNSQTNQQINSLVLNNHQYLEFTYFALLNLKDTMVLYGANGATMTNLNKGKFEALKVITPKEELINQFHSLTGCMFDEIKNLQLKNHNIRQTRDLLLHRLISSEFDVENIDIAIPNKSE